MNWLVACIAACKVALHLYADRYYGYFRDELYYLACSRHLEWGYVDQPPLIAVVAWAVRSLLGDSLSAIRLLPALAGAGEVILTAAIVRQLGGGWYAQALAALAVFAAPGILVQDQFLTMNAFEPLFWMGCAYLAVRIINTGDRKLWIWLGVLAGLGLENKYSMGLFGAALVIGLLLTPERRALMGLWPWMAGAIALALFLPNLIWNVQHHFPFLELQANIRRSGRDVSLGFFSFFGEETLAMNPVALPIWLAGLWFFFARQNKYRVLGWAWVITAFVIFVLSPRVYYLFPAFPVMFAGGAIVLERFKRARLAYPALLIISTVILAPLVIPVLPPEKFIAYETALHVRQPRIETHKLGPLPQLYADQFGWNEMAATVAGVYNNLPPDVRAKTAIFGQNYGEAGAIDFFGPRYGLPPAISGHQSYFLWGPRDYTGESMIVMADRQSRLEELFGSVEKVARVEHPYSMPYEHFDVFYCRNLKRPLKELWPEVKNWN
jgi:4-amino-4-deoxy-L-arabinose transferase-like glycosyltransferase